ncbi:anthranilate synthase component I [Methanococcus voltae]|uniref:Anthranilate synthase component 1 n=1 Tax=Methanococcus voltae (strain ATCC BAA-1334 / A3) TaxID=456320 RepID=D7DSX7_METV3|nr:anthranilate synthase component I [Methanococcus voltae]MCS3901873.1 anthranilate synthase component 1 [Methanococcus voltae]
MKNSTEKNMKIRLNYVNPLVLYSLLKEEGKYPVMLESRSKGQTNARYTYISSNPEYMLRVKNKTKIDNETVSKESNPFKALKEISNDNKNNNKLNFDKNNKDDRFTGGYLGYMAYDCIHNYIGGKIEEPSVFGYYDHMYVYDHLLRKFYYYSENNNSIDELKNAEKIVEKAKKIQISDKNNNNNKINKINNEMNTKEIEILGCDADFEEYTNMVEKAKEHIYAGDCFQIVPSREYYLKSEYSAFELYKNLRKINPSPYMFLLEFDKKIVGASPETMASVQNNVLKVNPIAGTAPVGKNDSETEKFAKELLNDEKERAEHMMLVDLARNDVRKVCKPGSVVLERFFDVVKYSHVQHLESEVIGDLDEKYDYNMFDAIEATFPAGTLTGAPKFRAMEIIDKLEKSRRKVYGGAVGYFSNSGNADLAIGIRMAEIEKNGICSVRAGAGIVADSVPEKEYYETERKMMAMMKALGVKNNDFE